MFPSRSRERGPMREQAMVSVDCEEDEEEVS